MMMIAWVSWRLIERYLDDVGGDDGDDVDGDDDDGDDGKCEGETCRE